MDETTPDRFDAWSFCRDVLAMGAAIQQDTAAGGRTYEQHSARLDAKAAYYAARLAPRPKPAPQLVLSESDHYPEG